MNKITYSDYNEVLNAYPYTHWNTVWKYNNRLVLSKKTKVNNSHMYLFFTKNANDSFTQIGTHTDFNEGVEMAIEAWEPKTQTVKTVSMKTYALDYVQNMICSKIKKNKLDELEKEDFTFAWYNKDGWKKWVAGADGLLEHHMRLPAEERNQAYLDFLEDRERVSKILA